MENERSYEALFIVGETTVNKLRSLVLDHDHGCFAYSTQIISTETRKEHKNRSSASKTVGERSAKVFPRSFSYRFFRWSGRNTLRYAMGRGFYVRIVNP